jgi:hypothetical protein
MHTHPITRKAKETEKNMIKNILHNNEYDTSLIEKPINQGKQRTDIQTHKTKKQNGSRLHTKIFRDTKLKVAYRT